jgi:hypothetical protein
MVSQREPSHSVACSWPQRSPSSRNSSRLRWPWSRTAARSPRLAACSARVLSAAASPHWSGWLSKAASARPGQLLAGGQVAEVGRGEAEEPLGFGLPGRVVQAVVGLERRARIPAAPGQQREAGQPGRREGPGWPGPTAAGGKASSAAAGGKASSVIVGCQRGFQRPPCLGEPPAQEPVPGHRARQPQRQVRLALTQRAVERAVDIGGLLIQALKPSLLVMPARLGRACSARAV